MVLVYVLLAAVAICLSFSVRIRKVARFLYLGSKIPGPSLWQLLTVHAKHLLSDEMVTYTWELCAVYNYKPWSMWMPNGGFLIVVSDCETIGAVYKNKHTREKSDIFYKQVENIVGKSLFTMSSGQEYTKHRKSLGAGLQKGLQGWLLPRMFEPMSDFVRMVREDAVGRKDVDVRNIVNSQMMASAAYYLVSDLPDKFLQMIPLYIQHAPLRFELVIIEMINPIYFHLYARWKASSRHNIKAINTFTENFDQVILNERFRTIQSQDENRPHGALAAMISTYENLISGSDQEFCKQFRFILLAIIDTTSYVANVLLLMLALHQDVQQRLFEEISSVLEEAERPIVIEDLDRMKYMEMVIKETLRLYPPGPWLPRKTSAETSIHGVLAPEGSTIILNAMAVHRNPDYFPDPLKFNPDRFSPEASERILPFSYIPFSGGTRSCPGELQAFLMLKLFLCNAVKNFVILPGDKLKSMDDIKAKMTATMHLKQSSLRFVDRSSGKQ